MSSAKVAVVFYSVIASAAWPEAFAENNVKVFAPGGNLCASLILHYH